MMMVQPLYADDNESADTVPKTEKKPNFIKRFIDSFDRQDENYIEPQHYIFTVMAQSTYSYDRYTLRSAEPSVQRVTFVPDGTLKVGPYFGWRWVFGGYTFSLTHSDFSKKKTEMELNLYTSRFGIDAFYRRTGVDYKLHDVSLGEGIDTEPLEGLMFDGVKAGITGVNLYYIFNDRRFSYPAAFAQSTCQKISCGSWLAGISYANNTLEFDYERMQDILGRYLPPEEARIDSALMISSLHYHDIDLTGGYAYNWVFARNWLFCASGQVGVGYKYSSGDASNTVIDPRFTDFSFYNINLNLVGRFAVVFNNTRWYAGISTIVHSNTYRESRFSANNIYGNVSMYVGYNFGLKKRYRKKK